MTPKEFLAWIKPHALKLQNELGIPAAVIAAQAALETGWGKSAVGNNLFGIKWTGQGPYQEARTTEYVNGKKQSVIAKFRAYETPYESLRDHSAFLLENPRYSQALAVADDPERFAEEIARAGYATDPKYAAKLKSIMRLHGLLEWPRPPRLTLAQITAALWRSGVNKGKPVPNLSA
ncbi:MAG: glucosaminidase domain-containing protein [Limnochordales bacterium]|nr:glucosaminidase domain-containing protein [Limnochordales bacterium]